MRTSEVGTMLVVQSTGKTLVTSGGAAIYGVTFCGSGTGQVQFFAGVTASASLTPVINFSGTASAVAGGFSPMFLRMPAEVSGNGLIIDLGATTDPNIILFWQPNPKTP